MMKHCKQKLPNDNKDKGPTNNRFRRIRFNILVTVSKTPRLTNCQRVGLTLIKQAGQTRNAVFWSGPPIVLSLMSLKMLILRDFIMTVESDRLRYKVEGKLYHILPERISEDLIYTCFNRVVFALALKVRRGCRTWQKFL